MSVADSESSQPETDMMTWDVATTKAVLAAQFPTYKEVLEEFIETEDYDGACLSELTSASIVGEFLKGPKVSAGLRVKLAQFVNSKRPAPEPDRDVHPKRAKVEGTAGPATVQPVGWEALSLTDARAHVRAHMKPLYEVLKMSNDDLKHFFNQTPALRSKGRTNSEGVKL